MAATLLSPEGRATALLRQHLTDAQRATYDAWGYVDQRAPSGKVYRVYQLSNAFDTCRVYHLARDGSLDRFYCVAPIDLASLPGSDATLALVLFLRHDERTFLVRANAGLPDGEVAREVAATARLAAQRRATHWTVGSTPEPPVPLARRLPLPWPILVQALGSGVTVGGLLLQSALVVDVGLAAIGLAVAAMVYDVLWGSRR